MTDVFISYARVDRPTAEKIASGLSNYGWSVWWDRTIPPGKTFDEVIEQAVDASRCMIVVWSQAAVESKWVRAEADEGLSKKALIPVRIEDVQPPLAFRQIQAADLIGWDGEADHAGFRDLVDALTAVVGPPANADAGMDAHAADPQRAGDRTVNAGKTDIPARRPEVSRPTSGSTRWTPWIVAAAVVLVTAVSATGYGVSWWYERKTEQEIQARQAAADQAAAARTAEQKAAAERAVAERAAADKAAAEKAAAEKAEAERLATKRAAEKAAAEKAKAERLAAERAAAEKAAAEKAEAERLAAERAAAEKAAAEKAEAERLAAERAAAEKAAAEKVEAERAAAERAAAARKAADNAAAGKAAAERLAAEKAATERTLAARAAAEPVLITLSFGNFQTGHNHWLAGDLDAFVVKTELRNGLFSTTHYEDGLKIYLDGQVGPDIVLLTGSIFSDSTFKSIEFRDRRISLQGGGIRNHNMKTDAGLSAPIAFELSIDVEYKQP